MLYGMTKTRLRKTILPWICLSPALTLILFVLGFPIVVTLGLAFTNWDGIAPPEFSGLQNFRQLFQDRGFLRAFVNNFKWNAYYLTIPVIASLLVALVISRLKRGRQVVRTVVFLPYILSAVVTGKIWMWIYNPYIGINVKLEQWGWDFLALDWIANPNLTLFSVAVADSWQFFGFLVVIFLVGLQHNDKQLEEAAKVEGANSLQIFWHVILPQLRPTLMLVYMLLIVWSVATFRYVWVMTQGGPGHASELLATYMYKVALYEQRFGYACAVALTMGLMSLLIVVGFRYIRKKGWEI